MPTLLSTQIWTSIWKPSLLRNPTSMLTSLYCKQIRMVRPFHLTIFFLKSPEFVSGYVKTYLILPPTIYGIATGPLTDRGLQHSRAHRIPSLVKIAIERGQGGLIGLGKNIWSQVHISDRTFPFHFNILYLSLIFASIFDRIQFCQRFFSDLRKANQLTNTYVVADLYVLILDKTLAGEPIGHGRTSLYFCENGEYVMHDLVVAITHALHSRGKSMAPTPTAFTMDEIKHYFPNGTMFGANSRCRADRSRAIGWRPKKGPEEILANVEEEIPN